MPLYFLGRFIMKHIHWFPGHIAKAQKQLKEMLGLVDVVIEVIDARIPLSSGYPEIEKLLGKKPRLILLNKSDLADEKKLDYWKNRFENLFSSYAVKTDFLYNASLPINAIDYNLRAKTIIYAAHMNANKAYDILLKAFAKISPKYPDWTLVMMGDGEIEKAKNMVEVLGISNQTVFTGYVTGKEKDKYFQEASIFCMCSYQEGLPMVVLEAWEYGIPVVTTPVGGLPDVIEEGKNAVTFSFGNYHELADKLEYLINDLDKRTFMSFYSKGFVHKNFSTDTISNKLNHIYQTI